MPAAHELIAHGRSEDEVREAIGADKLIYQDIDDLIEAVGQGNQNIHQFDTSCFTREYITGDIDEAYLARIESLRNDSAKESRRDNNLVEA
jgi:amidophosphoribosyltransferase